jgi:hypothetical protein
VRNDIECHPSHCFPDSFPVFKPSPLNWQNFQRRSRAVFLLCVTGDSGDLAEGLVVVG